MTNVLVCIKRVPDAAGEVLLTADEQALDARFVGFTVSAHENCAVELAVRIGDATVLSLGPADTVEQLRGALGVGAKAAVLIEADPVGYGPADIAREIAAVVTAHEAEGKTYDLILLGNDAADTGDFQVGIRLAYELGRPVVNGVRTVEVDGGVATARGDGIDGVETYAVPLPDDHRSDEGEEDPDRDGGAASGAARIGPGTAHLAARPAQHGRRARRGPRRRGRGRRPAAAPGGGPMILVFVETAADGATEVSLETVTFARSLAERSGGGPVHAVVVGALPEKLADELAAYGVAEVHHAVGEAFSAYAGAAWAAAVDAVRGDAGAVLAAGTPRGMEVLAHLAARLDVAMAANVVAIGTTEPLVVIRQVQGGAVLEEMRLPEQPALLTVAGHAVEATPAAAPGAAVVRENSPEVAAADLLARVVSTEPAGPDESGALTSARVVVGAGRGAGS